MLESVGVVLSLRSGLVLSLIVCGEIGPSTASLANQAPVYCGCPAATHGCDLVSRVRLDQSANPVVVWLSLVSRVHEVIVVFFFFPSEGLINQSI